jgi:hypothetical protein
VLLDEEATVRAFAEAIIQQHSRDARLEEPVAQFLLDVRMHMPDYLRIPFRILGLIFDAWAIPLTGRPFHRLSNRQRLIQIHAWRSSRIEARRRFIEFYESLAVFGLYSELYGNDYKSGGQDANA